MYRAARWWRLTMPEFRAMEKRDQAEATAVFIVEQKIESYYASEYAKKADKEKQKNEAKAAR